MATNANPPTAIPLSQVENLAFNPYSAEFLKIY